MSGGCCRNYFKKRLDYSEESKRDSFMMPGVKKERNVGRKELRKGGREERREGGRKKEGAN